MESCRNSALEGTQQGVGAGNCVTLCGLGAFMDQATGPVPAQNAHTGHSGRRHAQAERAQPAAPGTGRSLM
jgi:hypothetical protein